MVKYNSENFQIWKEKVSLLNDVFLNMAIKKFPELIEMLISVFSLFKLVGPYSVQADYKVYEKGIMYEFDALAIDSDGNHFIVEMQNVYDSTIAERFDSYMSLVKHKILEDRNIEIGVIKKSEWRTRTKESYEKVYPSLERQMVIGILFLNKITPSFRKIGVGSKEDPVYTFNEKEVELGSYPSCPTKFVVDVNADSGNDLRASILRDLKQSDPKKVENELIRRILEFFKNTIEGVVTMGNGFFEIYSDGEAKGRAVGKAEGRAEGLVEGRVEERKSIYSAFSKSETIEEVDKETGFSREQLTKMYINLRPNWILALHP